jgi:membrane protein implicated in regulation of membrane protease activity
MQDNRPPPRVTYEKGIRIGGPGWFGRLLAVLLSAIVFVAAALLSVVLFAVLFAAGAVIVGYLWWKMRALRRRQADALRGGAYGDGGFRDDGRTIDMEVVHKDSPEDDSSTR